MNCLCSGVLFADVACWPIEHVPIEGELVQTERIELSLGGCAANVASDLARLGVDTKLAGTIGDDALSDYIIRALSVPHIDTALVQRVSRRCPGTALHINVANEDRRFICTPGANDDFTFDDELIRFLETPAESENRIFYLGGFLMLKKLENPQTPAILHLAKKHGWTTILDVVLYGNRDYWEAIEPLLPEVDIFTPNEFEAEKLTGESNLFDQAKTFLDAGVKAAVITHGTVGTLYYSETESFRTGVYPMKFAGGAGAGDAFAAGLIAALLEGRSRQEAVSWGSAMGGSCIRGVNTTGHCFNREQLIEFVEHHRLEIETVC